MHETKVKTRFKTPAYSEVATPIHYEYEYLLYLSLASTNAIATCVHGTSLVDAKLRYITHSYCFSIGVISRSFNNVVCTCIYKHSLHPVLVDATSTDHHMALRGTVGERSSEPVDKFTEYTAFC